MTVALALSLAALVVSLSAATQVPRDEDPSVIASASSLWHSAIHRHSQRRMVSNHGTRTIDCPCGWSRRWGWRP